MSGFGHIHSRGGGAFIDAWGRGPFLIVVKDKTYRFEDSDVFGPARLNASGDPSAVNFGAKSPFWEAHRLWRSQGRKVEADRITCVWREPIPTIVQKIGPMHMVIQHGEPNAYGGTQWVQIEAPKRGKPSP